MISYSFHLSSKAHAISTIAKAAQVSRHNLRQYKSEHYDRNEIEIIYGSDKSILDDIRNIYHQEFDEPLKSYNEHVRADRRIDDYLKHVSESRGDIAAEIIIQIGDQDFWRDKTQEERHQMSQIFRNQAASLQKLCPNFKIASIVAHYEENSPHAHILGVTVCSGGKRGLSKKVSKTKVFTRDSLQMLQTKMREYAEQDMKQPQFQNLFKDIDLKPKEKGRNKDIPKYVLDEYYQAIRETEMKRESELILDSQLREKNRNIRKLARSIAEKSAQAQELDETLKNKRKDLSNLDKKISEHEDLNEVINIYNQAYADEIEIGYRERAKERDWEL